MNHSTRPDSSTPPGEPAGGARGTELTEAELDGVTGGMLAGIRTTGTVIRPTTQPTGTGTGGPATSQDTQTEKPFQPQPVPR